MATYDFNLPIDEIIEEAYEMINMDQLGVDDIRSAKRSLNLLLIDIQNRDIPLSHLEKITINLVQGQEEYTMDEKVLDLLSVTLRRDGVDLPLSRMSLFDYNNQPNKTTEGRPTTYIVDRQKAAVIVTVWQSPENSTDTLTAWTYRKNANVSNYTDFADIATRYIPALTVGLAYYLALKKNVERAPALRGQFEQLLDNAFMEDRERTSIYFSPRVKGD